MLNKNLLNDLLKNKFFENVNPKMLKQVDSSFFTELTFDKGEIVVKEDSIADEMYLIVEGKVKITKMVFPDSEVEVEIARRKEGDFVGELAMVEEESGSKIIEITEREARDFIGELSLIERKKRSATVHCLTPVRLIRVEKTNFYKILESLPQVKYNIAKVIASRLRESDKKMSSEIAKYELLLELHQKINEQNKKLEEQKQELMELNATKDKFLTIIAHDIKNPLGVIIGTSNLLFSQFDKFDKDKLRELVFNINDSANRLDKLLENLLYWSWSQTGRMECNPKEMDFYHLTQMAISFFGHTAENKDIEINPEVPENMMVFADLEMVKTILRNLISNAIKFTHRGGEIKIAARQKDEDFVEVSVMDNGVGISEDVVKKLFRFDIHYSSRGTQKEKGTGLGLLLCKEFVESHGGEIWVESEKGEGSAFKFTLPRKMELVPSKECE